MPVDARDLTTIEALKAWLNLSANADDTQLQRLVTSVSVGVLQWLSREIKSVERIETYDGTGSNLLLLREGPVTAVSRVVVDGADVTSFRFTSSALVRMDGWWAAGFGNVQVTYTAGFASIPSDVEQAVLEIAAERWKGRQSIGLSSKGFGQETTSFLTHDWPDSAKTALMPYRSVVPC